MRLRMPLRDIPTRAATGAYVLHSGIEKLSGSEEQAKQLHGFASEAYPILGDFEPKLFLRLLSAAELATGAILLNPFVPSRLAGVPLTAFSGGLVGLYLRTPSMHKEGSVWPTRAGIAVSKDAWMLAIGLSLLLGPRRRRRRSKQGT